MAKKENNHRLDRRGLSVISDKQRRVFLSNYGNFPRTDAFNCWGATLLYFGVTSKLRWLEQKEIIQWLSKFTAPVPLSEKRIDDILVLRTRALGVIHTAVYLSENQYWHKNGSEKAEIISLEGILEKYKAESFEYCRRKP